MQVIEFVRGFAIYRFHDTMVIETGESDGNARDICYRMRILPHRGGDPAEARPLAGLVTARHISV